MAVGPIIWIMYFVSIYFAVFWILVILDNDLKDPKRGKKSKRKPLVTIAIPVWNEEESVIDTIKSVLALDYPLKKIEILVVDDYSTDKTAERMKAFLKTYDNTKGAKIEFISHKVNKGKGAALNTALRRAKGELFICLDADSFVEPSALETMLPYFEDESVASVLPVIKLREIKGFSLYLQYTEYLVNFFLKKVMSLLNCVHVTPGPFGAYKTKALHDVNGFVEDNLTEDLEMALRLQKHQYRIIQLMGAKVSTIGPNKIKGWFNQRNRWYKGTLYNLFDYRKLFFNKKYGEFGMFQLPMVLGAAMLSICFAVFVFWQHLIQPLLEKIYDMSYINFDVGLMSQLWLERFSFLDINYLIIFFTFVMSTIGIAWIVAGHRFAQEPMMSKQGLGTAALYMVVYPFFLSLVWMGVVFDVVRGKKQKW